MDGGAEGGERQAESARHVVEGTESLEGTESV